MSSAQQPAEPDISLESEDPKATIRRVLGTEAEKFGEQPVTKKDALEDYIKKGYGTDYVPTRIDDTWPELTETVDDDLEEGDGRLRGLSEVLPHDGPRGDVYQYVPRKPLADYKYVCNNVETRTETRWSISGEEQIEIEIEEECGASFTRECRGLPAKCHRCAGWIRPEDGRGGDQEADS